MEIISEPNSHCNSKRETKQRHNSQQIIIENSQTPTDRIINLSKNHLRTSLVKNNELKQKFPEEFNKMLEENTFNIKPAQELMKLNKLEETKMKLTQLQQQKQAVVQEVSVQTSLIKKITDENSDVISLKNNIEKKLKEVLKIKQEYSDQIKLMTTKYEKELEIFRQRKEKNYQETEKSKEILNSQKKVFFTKINEIKNYEEQLNNLNLINNEINTSLQEKINLRKNLEKLKAEKLKKLEEIKQKNENLAKINNNYIEYHKYLHNELQEARGNIRVYCRIRPKLNKEKNDENNAESSIEYLNLHTFRFQGPVMKSNVGNTKSTQKGEIFHFDCVFKPETTQEEVFSEISQLVQSALDGYKVCIFAYGQTGSGKTFTMEGDPQNFDRRGIIPRSVEKLFQVCKNLDEIGWKFKITVSMFEIYIDQCIDLLASNKNSSKTENPLEFEVGGVENVYSLLEMANKRRSTAETQCNENSSRSHFIFQLKIFGKNVNNGQTRDGALNLVDLAGSERVSSSKVEGERLKETQAINKSLAALGDVITALVSKAKHIPYRNTKLTTVLQNHLGGDSKTLMFVNISPLLVHFNESFYSLKFAQKVNLCSTEEK